MIRICVTGPDGTGKSTLVSAVVEALDRHHGPGTAVHTQVWDSLQALVTREQAQRYLGTIDDRSRALLLLHTVSRALAMGEATGARVVLLDGYWYKYAVSELEHGAPEATFATCPAVFPRPDQTFVLDLPVGEAAARKVQTTAYERGFAGPGAFEVFQERLRARWRALEADVGPWIHLDARQPPDSLCEQVVRAIEDRLQDAR